MPKWPISSCDLSTNGTDVTSVYVNHNALVDETLFQIETTTLKGYDAVYNAVLAPFKRHAFASKVRSLALITYFKEGSD